MFYLPRFISSPIPTSNLLSQFPCTNKFPFLSLLFPFHVIIHFPFLVTLGVGYASVAFCRGDGDSCFCKKSVVTSQTARPYFTMWAPEIFSVYLTPFSFLWLGSAVGHGLFIFEVSKSHSDTPHSVGILWTSPSQRHLSDITQNSQETIITASGGFEPAILASERQQTNRLDRTANGIV